MEEIKALTIKELLDLAKSGDKFYIVRCYFYKDLLIPSEHKPEEFSIQSFETATKTFGNVGNKKTETITVYDKNSRTYTQTEIAGKEEHKRDYAFLTKQEAQKFFLEKKGKEVESMEFSLAAEKEKLEKLKEEWKC